jgi:hypothetical protein
MSKCRRSDTLDAWKYFWLHTSVLNLENFAKTQEKQQYHNLTLRMRKREIKENFRDAAVG